MCNIARLCVILSIFSFQKNETPGNACNMCNMCNIDKFQFPKKNGTPGNACNICNIAKSQS